jgi:tight adherence protein C
MPGITLAPFMFSFSVFVFVFCMVWAGIAMYRDYVARRAMLEKVRSEISPISSLLDASSLDSQGNKRDFPIMSLFGKIGNRYADEKTLKYSALRDEFLQAGIRNRMAIPAFWGIKITLMVALPLLFFIVRTVFFVGLADYGLTLVICAVLVLVGMYVPDVCLRYLVSSRKTRISHSLPDAIDMLVVCVEAGLGLDAAISRVSNEMQLTAPDLSDELRYYNLEMRAGTSREEALHNLTRRTDLDEIRSLTNLLMQTNRFGTSLAQALRVYSESFRTKRFMQAEERAATLPTKLVIPVLLFIFPALFVVIAFPAAIRIYTAFIASGN